MNKSINFLKKICPQTFEQWLNVGILVAKMNI